MVPERVPASEVPVKVRVQLPVYAALSSPLIVAVIVKRKFLDGVELDVARVTI